MPRSFFEATGGQPPYTFTYQIDGGASQTVSTTGNNNSVKISVNTSAVKNVVYKITKIRDSSSTPIEQDLDVSRTLTINQVPLADFSFNNNNTCSGTSIKFTASASGSQPLTYTWNFGDNTSSTEQHPSHVFSALGCGTVVFKVTLTVTDINGCSSSITKDVTVKQIPEMSFSDLENPFSAFNNCSGASMTNPFFKVKLENTSKSAGCLTSYSLNWDDGSSPVNNASFPAEHTYTKLGAFYLKISGEGTNGCRNDITYLVRNVTNPSVGAISPGTTTNLCAPTDELRFEIAKWGDNSLETTYEVDYGDGTPKLVLNQSDLISSAFYNQMVPLASSNYPIPHSYKRSSCPEKEFVVKVTATNVCSSTSGTVNNITVLSKSEPDFEFTSVCLNTEITIRNTTISGFNQDCSTTSIFTWDFGDGTSPVTFPISLPKDAKHTYTSPGKYDVVLKARNYCGESSKMHQVTINPLPEANMSGGATVCMNDPSPLLTFTGTSGIGPYLFTYKINNGPNQTIRTTLGNSVTYPIPTLTAGKFTYSLVSVADGNGCIQAQTEQDTI
jgi:large repetitive protein